MKTAIAFLLIVLLASCELKEDKGDTEKFIGIWKVESYAINGKQIMNDSPWVSGIIKITDNYSHYINFDGLGEQGKNKENIFFDTEEMWTSFKGWDDKQKGNIRFEKGTSVKLRIFLNYAINGVYELQGNSLVIKGTEYGGTLHHIILTRYSY